MNAQKSLPPSVIEAAKLYSEKKIDYGMYTKVVQDALVLSEALETLGHLGQESYRKGETHGHQMDEIYRCAEAIRDETTLPQDTAQDTIKTFETFLLGAMVKLNLQQYDSISKRLKELKERTRAQALLDMQDKLSSQNTNATNTPANSTIQSPLSPLSFKELNERNQKLAKDRLAKAKQTVQKFTPQQSQTASSKLDRHNVLGEKRSAPGGTEEAVTLHGGWEIVANDDKLVIRSLKTQKALLTITHESITVGEESGENITLGETQ